jgi:hypothetical protein
MMVLFHWRTPVLAAAVLTLVLAGCAVPSAEGAGRAALAGTTYYVSTSGSDANNGTSQSTPWKTIAKVNAATLTAGSSVLFNGGQTFSGSLTITASGTSASWITVSSYGTGKAKINAGTGNGIYIHDAGYVAVTNLVVYGGWNSTSQSGNSGAGVWFLNDLTGAQQLGSIKLDQSEVYGFQSGGVLVGGQPSDGTASGYSQVYVTNSLVHDNGKFGVCVYGTTQAAGSTAYNFPYVYVGYNKVYNNLGVSSFTTNHSGDGILVGEVSGGTLEHNVTYNNGWKNGCSTAGPCGLWAWDSTNLVFQYNESYGNGTPTGYADGDGFDLDGGVTNSVVQYNYSHGNYGAGFLLWEYGNTRVSNGGNTVRYNVSQANATDSWYGEITVGATTGTCSNNVFYNNTLYNTTGSCVNDAAGASGSRYYNNIFYATNATAAIVTTANATAWFLDNDYYNSHGFKASINGTSYTSWSTYRAAHYNEYYSGASYGYNADPQCLSVGTGGTVGTEYPNTLTNYQLASASPLKNAGYNLTSWGIAVGATDFNLTAIPYSGGYNVGACP